MLSRLLWLGLVIEIYCLCPSAFAGQMQSVSLADPSQAPPAGGSGDSIGPIISPDGRYVLFASTANNLVLTAGNTPLPVLIPPKLNVFLRDRTNQTTTLVSVNLAGNGGGNGDSIPVAISTNGQYVLFESSASNLVAAANNGFMQIFLRNLASNSTVLVSATSNGSPANGICRGSVMTPDGRYVAFTSEANNLVASDTNGIADVFVRDVIAGATTLVSVGASNLALYPPGLAGVVSIRSDFPEITADGRYVVFSSTATNLVAGVASIGDIYVRDLVAGNTIWASAGARPFIQGIFGAANSNIVCQNHTISADGQHVAYEARPVLSSVPSAFGVVFRFNVLTSQTDVITTNAGVSAQLYDDPGDLTMTPDGQFIAFVGRTNIFGSSNTCILVWSALTGLNVLASVNLSNSVSTNVFFDWPVIDPTGRYVAFQSSATDLTTNSLPGTYHLFVRDLEAGITTLVDADTNGVGTGVGPNAEPSLSTNGPSIAFEAPDGNLVPNDRNRALDVFVRNVAAGTNELISACQPALSSLTPNGLSTMTLLSVNNNGRYVAFTSDADNLVPSDTNGWRDVFVRDLLLGTNILISEATNGGVGNDESFGPSISNDGRYVAFTSSASNLVANDFNNSQDVFVRDTQTGTTVLVSVNTNGVSGGSDSYSPIMRDDRLVLWHSKATDLASVTFTTGSENLFLRDLQNNVTYPLTTGGNTFAAMTADGRFVVFVGGVLSTNMNLYVWDTQAAQRVYTNTTAGIVAAALSGDGNILTYVVSNSVSALNRASNTTWQVASGPLALYSGLKCTSDGEWLVYATAASLVGSDTNGASDVYLYDLRARTNFVVSHVSGSGYAANGPSDSPDISSDDRFIIYRSVASNLVPGASNGAPQIFIYDRNNASTSLITISQLGIQSSENRSLTPAFSGDAQTLIFESWSPDLVAQDANFNGDVFAYALVTNIVDRPFFAQIVAGSGSSATPTVTWTAVPGKTYAAQYKNNVTDAVWQNVGGGVTIVGSLGIFTDPAPSPSQRFYRIVAF